MGAGSSGIGAAKTLYDAGDRDFLVIEAQDYIGGRSKVATVGDRQFNVGASWIMGACTHPARCRYKGILPTGVNPMQEFADQFGFSYVLTDFGDDIALGQGGVVETGLYEQAQDDSWNVHTCIGNLNNLDTKTWEEAMEECDWSADDAASKSAQWYDFEWLNGVRANQTKAGTRFLNSKSWEWFGWEDLFFTDPRGYQGIVQKLAEPFLDRVLLNSPIATIAYGADSGVTVTLDNGDTYSADHGIVSFSLGVLKSDLVTFSPPVPSAMQTAWNTFGMCHFAPILIKWPFDFWSQHGSQTPQWYVFNSDNYGYFPMANNLDHADLYPGSLTWRMDTVSDVAKQVQKLSVEQISSEIVAHLSQYFAVVPIPQEIVIGDWSENQYTQGAYAYWPPGTTLDMQDDMRQSIDNVLFFAGEHTYPYETGFMHTAYWSGVWAAQEIQTGS